MNACLSPQKRLPDVGILQKVPSGIFHHNLTDAKDVSAVSDLQGHIGILLYEENRHSALLQRPNGSENCVENANT